MPLFRRVGTCRFYMKGDGNRGAGQQLQVYSGEVEGEIHIQGGVGAMSFVVAGFRR